MITRAKKLLAILICTTLSLVLSLPVFAAPGGIMTSDDIYPLDTPHGHYFHSGPYYLNQWGSNPVSGTRVTTWEKTGDITQAWDVAYTTSGHWVVTTNQRRDLALNIYRSGAQPEVNVIAYIGNTYNDCALTIDTLILANQSGTYRGYGVTLTNESTKPANAFGQICRWTNHPTNWQHDA